MSKKKTSTKLKRKSLEDTKDVTIIPNETTKVKEIKRSKSILFGWLSPKKTTVNLPIRQKLKLKNKPESSFMVTMFFRNGTSKTWVVQTTESTFRMGEMYYSLYYEETVFDLTLNQFHLYYHEDFAVPINRELVQQGDDAFFSVKPSNLKELIKQWYTRELTGSGITDKTLRLILIMVVISLVASALTLLSVWGLSNALKGG